MKKQGSYEHRREATGNSRDNLKKGGRVQQRKEKQEKRKIG